MHNVREITAEDIDSVYFVEEFIPLLRNIKGKIIALNPRACYQLDKEKIPYRICEEFYGMPELGDNVEGYSARLYSWIDAFDGYLRGKLSSDLDKKINFVRVYGYFFRRMLDPLIIYSRAILSVLNELNPAKVYLIGELSSAQYPLNRELLPDDISLASFVLPFICKQKGISCLVINIDKKTFSLHDIFLRLRHFYKRIVRFCTNNLEGIYIQTVYLLLFLKRIKLKKEGKLKTFLVLRDDWLGDFCKDVIKAGCQVFFHTMYGPKSLFFFRGRAGGDEISDFYIEEKTAVLWKKISENCIKEFNPSKLANDEACIDLSFMLNERFCYFLEKICPIISAAAEQYEVIFKKKNISYVVCQYKIFPSEFGVMAAATISPEVTSVLVEHGSSEAEYKLQYLTELPTNIYVTSSKDEAVFYDKFLNNGNEYMIKVIAGSAWIDRYKSEAKKIAHRFLELKEKKISNPGTRVYYLPSSQSTPRFDPAYLLCWYFQLQKALCGYFKKMPQYHFVVKVDPSVNWLSDPVAKTIKVLRAPNISYEEGDLVRCLREADRVITDFPSTPTYEARLMGLPVISLYHESINIRPVAKQLYGKTLVPFKTAQDAIKQIDRFLSSTPEEYIVSVEDNFLSPTLSEILLQEEKNL